MEDPFVIAQRQLDEAKRTLPVADVEMLAKIEEIGTDGDTRELSMRVRSYYADRDRADRTPREILYFHLGLLSGEMLNRDAIFCQIVTAWHENNQRAFFQAMNAGRQMLNLPQPIRTDPKARTH